MFDTYITFESVLIEYVFVDDELTEICMFRNLYVARIMILEAQDDFDIILL